ncbi:MAG: hypothetical protein A2W20_04550 [Candidatus Aminicenantes bacterium RBG_16_66_30]|nr:MAG: hypothetical protein A2W20_04550 [Candidatus Aminicenantes bacterium RBG_16_66_30]
MIAALALALGAAAGAEEGAVKRLKAAEIAGPENAEDAAVLGRPLALALGGDALFVADAQDCAIKVFSKEGRFLRAFGRKGQGPGELSFPSGVAAAGDRVLVADKFNSRVQVFDHDGKPAGAFAVPFLPDKVHALADGAVLVTGNPTGKRKGEAIVHVFDRSGGPRWEGVEAGFSGDPTYDAFRNMILAVPGEGADFYVVFRSGERRVLHFASTGALIGTITVDERHASRPIDLPFKRGKKRLAGFCWAAAFDRGLLYLSAPAPVDGKDLGPGREISVIDAAGVLRAVVALPRPVHRFVVEGQRIFGVDDEGELRIFEVVR